MTFTRETNQDELDAVIAWRWAECGAPIKVELKRDLSCMVCTFRREH
jgi:hypothetical protein